MLGTSQCQIPSCRSISDSMQVLCAPEDEACGLAAAPALLGPISPLASCAALDVLKLRATWTTSRTVTRSGRRRELTPCSRLVQLVSPQGRIAWHAAQP